MSDIKIHEHSMTVDYNMENLHLVIRDDELEPVKYWDGTVSTKYGIVTVQSWLVPFFRSKKAKMTFIGFIYSGIDYRKNITHYHNYTCTGLARIAGRFAKRCISD